MLSWLWWAILDVLCYHNYVVRSWIGYITMVMMSYTSYVMLSWLCCAIMDRLCCHGYDELYWICYAIMFMLYYLVLCVSCYMWFSCWASTHRYVVDPQVLAGNGLTDTSMESVERLYMWGQTAAEKHRSLTVVVLCYFVVRRLLSDMELYFVNFVMLI